MKKIFSMAVAAIAVAGMMSCNGNSPKASLKTDVDTLSYAIGMTQSQGLMDSVPMLLMILRRLLISLVSRSVSRFPTTW